MQPDWQIDATHSSISFRVKHLVVATVSGRMSGLKGVVKINEQDISKASVVAELDPSTIWTDNKKRDDHLRAADFLDVKKYPKIKFQSTSVKKVGKDELAVTGNLTIKKVTKQVVLRVEELTGAIKGPRGKCTGGDCAYNN